MGMNVYDTAVNTYNYDYLRSAVDGHELIKFPVKLKASSTFTKGMIIAESNATPGLFAEQGTASHSIAKAILPIDCVTDASGYITAGSQPANRAIQTLTIEAIFGGFVRCEDVVALDATLATELGKLVRGTVTNGVLHIGDGAAVYVAP